MNEKVVFNARMNRLQAPKLRFASIAPQNQFKNLEKKHARSQYVSACTNRFNNACRFRVSLGPRPDQTLSAAKSSNSPTICAPSTPTSLGSVFLNIFQGHIYYAFCYIMPIVTLIAAIGAIYTRPLLLSIASALPRLLPLPTITPTISTFLTFVATTQPWTGLVSITVSLLSAYYAFLLMPIMDFLLGTDYRNPDGAALRAAKKSAVYKAILRFYPFAHLSVLAIVLHLACTYQAAISPLAFIGIAVSCGVAGGILFAAAHELIHSTQKIDRWLGNALLCSVIYMHWSDSHLAHHVKVATVEDPSSARLGESLWHFIPRSIIGNLVDGWNWAEAGRLRRNRTINNNNSGGGGGGKKHDDQVDVSAAPQPKFPFWSLKNKLIWWFACPALLNTAVAAVYGLAGVQFMLIQALISILLLETVNFIEHYGLERQKIPVPSSSSSSKTVRYERVAPHHSWNASTIWTNSVTFSLQRHSDHHASDKRPFYLLNHIEDAPQLPAGYPAMMLLATVPPAFRKVMDPRVAEWKKQYYGGSGGGGGGGGAVPLVGE